MRVEQIGHGDLVEERRALAATVRNVFATPEFHETWWRHFGAGRDLRLTAVLDGERLAGLVPVYVWRDRPLPVFRVLGHGGGDDLGPVAAPADRARVAAAFRRAFPVTTLVDHTELEWAHALGAQTLLVEPSPRLQTRAFGGWDAYLATRSANFRQTVRNRERRLRRSHELTYRLADAGTLDADLDTLFRLHRDRWGGRRTTFGRRETFHRDFARTALARGWARLMLLELDGRAAAAWYGFRFAGIHSYYQSGRIPVLNGQAVGLVLLAHTIRCAFDDDDADEYRFLRGGEPYKFRFTDDDSSVRTVVCGHGARALALTAAVAGRLRALRD